MPYKNKTKDRAWHRRYMRQKRRNRIQYGCKSVTPDVTPDKAKKEPVKQLRVQQPRFIYHHPPLHIEDFFPKHKKKDTVAELQEHYKQLDYCREQVNIIYLELRRLLNEGSFVEARNTFQKYQEAWRKYILTCKHT